MVLDTLLGWGIRKVYNINNTLLKVDGKVARYMGLTRNDYYKKCSSDIDLTNASIPVLNIVSDDDPLIPKKVIEFLKYISFKNKNLISIITARGGHVAWLSNTFGAAWLPHLILDYGNVITSKPLWKTAEQS